MENVYSEQTSNTSALIRHKEEGEKRRRLDADDREQIGAELAKNSHPLRIESPVLYSIINGQVAPEEVNVEDALSVREKMVTSFQKGMPSGFHSKIACPVETMEQLSEESRLVTRLFLNWSPSSYVF